MSKVIRYSVTFLGTIELDDNDNPNYQQAMDMIADDFNQLDRDIGWANDVEYEIEGENEELNQQAKVAEYDSYIFWEG